MNCKFVVFSICALAVASGSTLAAGTGSPASSPATGAERIPSPTHDPSDAPPPGTPGEPQAQRDANAIDFYWRKSDEAFHAGDYQRSIDLHKAIVAIDPTEIQSFELGAWLMWSLGHGDEADAFIERGLRANPKNWEMWNAAGEQYDLQKLEAQAEHAYSQAVALIPKTENTELLRRRLAHAAEHNHDLATSLQTWNDLVRDFPNQAVNAHNRDRVEALVKAGPQANQEPTVPRDEPAPSDTHDRRGVLRINTDCLKLPRAPFYRL